MHRIFTLDKLSFRTLTIVLLSLIFSGVPLKSEAQILKRLGDKIERSVERRIDRKTDQAVEKTLDKVEDGAEQAVNDSVKGNDSVKSSADGGKPASITRTLPDNFRLDPTGSGPDLYMEYQVRVQGEAFEQNQMEMAMKMYTSTSKRGGRAEVIMNMPVIGQLRTVTLTDFDNPLQTIILNEQRKEYSVIDLEEVEESDEETQFEIIKLGEEKVHGLQCVHARAINKKGEAFEIWTTTEIPGYKDIAALYSKTQNMGSSHLWDALQKADAAGFVVKLEVAVEGGKTSMEMVHLEKTTVPESMLVVPADYKKKAGGWGNLFSPGK